MRAEVHGLFPAPPPRPAPVENRPQPSSTSPRRPERASHPYGPARGRGPGGPCRDRRHRCGSSSTRLHSSARGVQARSKSSMRRTPDTSPRPRSLSGCGSHRCRQRPSGRIPKAGRWTSWHHFGDGAGLAGDASSWFDSLYIWPIMVSPDQWTNGRRRALLIERAGATHLAVLDPDWVPAGSHHQHPTTQVDLDVRRGTRAGQRLAHRQSSTHRGYR